MFSKNFFRYINVKHTRKTNKLTPNENPMRKLDLTFNDHEAAFKNKTTWQVFRAYIVYTLCSINFLVDNNAVVMKKTRDILGKYLFIRLMKLTLYGHFVAGENLNDIKPNLARMRSFGVRPILDYSVEEDLSNSEAEQIELKAELPEVPVTTEQIQPLPQFQVPRKLVDRRYKASARTYFYLNEATCEKNMEIFIKCLESVAESDQKCAGFTAIKMTALGRPQLLLQISDVITRTRKFIKDLIGGEGSVLSHHIKPEDLVKRFHEAGISDTPVQEFLSHLTTDEEGVIHIFPWSGIIDDKQELSSTFQVPDLKTGIMTRFISQLSSKEEEMFRNMIRRVTYVAEAARELQVPVMIDAEQTYFQPAISRITLELMRKYNADAPIVYNTYQCYLRNTFTEVVTDLEQANRQNFYFAAKLVRGAYLDQERDRAQALGLVLALKQQKIILFGGSYPKIFLDAYRYEDPTCSSYEETSEMYTKTLQECLKRVKDLKLANCDAKRISIMVASHNEDTVRFAIEKMFETGVAAEDGVICFGQLLGMCDYITFPLGQTGFFAFKYVPYGPVLEVLPYLSRRAVENKGIFKKVKKEKKLLSKELVRRLLTLNFLRTPWGSHPCGNAR